MEATAGDTKNDAAEPQERRMGWDTSDMVEILPLGTRRRHKRVRVAAIPAGATDSAVGITRRHRGEQSKTFREVK